MVCLSPLSVSYQAIQCLISLRVLRSRETSLLPLRLTLDFSYFAVEEEQVRGWLSSKCIPVSNLRWIKRIIHTNMQSTYKSSFCGNWNYGRICGKALPGVHRLMPWDQLSSLGYSVTVLVTCIAASGSSVITLMSVTAFSLNTVAQLQGWGRDFAPASNDPGSNELYTFVLSTCLFAFGFSNASLHAELLSFPFEAG